MDNWLENKKLPYHLVSACGLVHRDGLVLLIQNPKRGWELPGGTVEQGERITEALKREVYEESGVICEPESLIGIYQNLAVKEGYGPLEGMKIPPIICWFHIGVFLGGITSTACRPGARPACGRSPERNRSGRYHRPGKAAGKSPA